MNSLLFTQCLQHDFVSPLERYEPLPNLLHIGYSESLRLMGERPEQGPVCRVMAWAHEQSADDLGIVHLRDWHSLDDPAQAEHLKRFGNHCLEHTGGAEFVFAEAPERAGVWVVNSLSLNDFQGTNLREILEPLSSGSLRVGLMGAWTEAKIYFLAYELATRYPHFEVMVCSALTASSSRSRHFQALDQMERILGVKVVHSVGEFVDFLGGADFETPLLGLKEKFPVIDCPVAIDDGARTLVRYLFRDCQSVKLRVLDGGFSGNLVMGTDSVDLLGHQQVPHVVKIGPQDLMGKERASFEQIQDVLGNNAPHIAEFADYGDRGGIKYRYASMGGSFSTTFQKMVEGGAPQAEIDEVLQAVFGEQLSRLYRARTLEQTDLLQHYQFSPRWAPGVRRRVEALLGEPADGDTLAVAPGLTTPNLCLFYEHHLQKLFTGSRCYQAYVHGDLNGANIIVDGHHNVWLIDFFHTRRAHVLMDLIKLENDLLYIFTKLDHEDELCQACELFAPLLEMDDLAGDLPARTFSEVKFQRCWDTLRTLRSFYPKLIHADRGPYQWWVGALRYAAHSLGFDECSPLQKRWALHTAGLLSEKLVTQHAGDRRLRVDWTHHDTVPGVRVGLTILPGRADRGRDMDEDIASLQEQGVEAVLCMVPQDELERYGAGELLARYRAAGLELLHSRVVDQKVCSVEEVGRLVEWIEAQNRAGRTVLAHCVGGLGRSGFAVACFWVSQGLSAHQAIQLVREQRSPRAVETLLQERLIEEFEEVSRRTFSGK